MTFHTTQKLCWAVILFAIGAASAAAGSGDDPRPTPTPRPRTLGDIKLKTVTGSDTDGRVVISDTNISELASRGSVSIGGKTPFDRTGPGPRKTPSRSERDRWRKKVLDQKKAIVELEKKRLRIEAQIDLIEDGRLTVRALARIQSAEIDLRAVEEEVRAEKAELGRLIREARRHGAEPGWFR